MNDLPVWRGKRARERERVCVYMCVKQMSCVLFCSPDWLVFVAAPSCRRAWPRASLSARTNPAHAALICQLQPPSPAPNNSPSVTGPAHSLDDAPFTHAYLPRSLFLPPPLTRTPTLCQLCHAHTQTQAHATGLSNALPSFHLNTLSYSLHSSLG